MCVCVCRRVNHKGVVFVLDQQVFKIKESFEQEEQVSRAWWSNCMIGCVRPGTSVWPESVRKEFKLIKIRFGLEKKMI